VVTATNGGCGEIGRSRELYICSSGPRVSMMAQIFESPTGGPPGSSPCIFVLTADMADDAGAPPPGIVN
jgi:hypothetical protein